MLADGWHERPGQLQGYRFLVAEGKIVHACSGEFYNVMCWEAHSVPPRFVPGSLQRALYPKPTDR